MLRTKIVTPIKPQISTFKADKSCQMGFNVYTGALLMSIVKRVKSFVHVSVSVCIFVASYCAYLLISCLEDNM
jgi:hypothetical protein